MHEKQATRTHPEPLDTKLAKELEELFRLEEEATSMRRYLTQELLHTPYVTVAWGRIRNDLRRGTLKA